LLGRSLHAMPTVASTLFTTSPTYMLARKRPTAEGLTLQDAPGELVAT
jgi:hypothetical protein